MCAYTNRRFGRCSARDVVGCAFICTAGVCDLCDQPNMALPSAASFDFLPPLPPDLPAPRICHHSELIMVTIINTSDGEPAPNTHPEANGAFLSMTALPSVRQGRNFYGYGCLSLSWNDTNGVNVEPFPPLVQNLPSDCPDIDFLPHRITRKSPSAGC